MNSIMAEPLLCFNGINGATAVDPNDESTRQHHLQQLALAQQNRLATLKTLAALKPLGP